MLPSADIDWYLKLFLRKGADSSSSELAALSRPRENSAENAVSWGLPHRGFRIQEAGPGFLCFRAGPMLLNFKGDCKSQKLRDGSLNVVTIFFLISHKEKIKSLSKCL